jgi:hypothetical protein
METPNKTNIVLTISLLILVPFSIISAIWVSLEINKIERDNQIEINTFKIYWEIEKVSPNDDNPQHFDIVLMSNAGAIKNYDNLLSYGLSHSRDHIAIHANNGIEIINLNDDSSQNIIFSEESFVGDSGNSLSWTFDDQYIVFTALNTVNINDTRVWVIKKDGSEINSFNAPIISWQDETGKVYVEKAISSPFNSLILTRTYREEDLLVLNEDNLEYQLTELPVILSIYTLKGNLVETLEIRDFGDADDKIYFAWDLENQGFIKYGIFSSSEEIDPNDISKLNFIKI